MRECLKEEVREQEKWQCPNCKVPYEPETKTSDLWKMPQVLIIRLKRLDDM